MKNLNSKILQGKNEIEKSPEIKIGERFDIYIHFLEKEKTNEKCLNKERFILLYKLKGIFRIENISELEHSAKYKLKLIRENLPKDYEKTIEKINNYSVKYNEDSFAIMS